MEIIRSRKEHDKLLLNDDKTEFFILGTKQQLSQVNISGINMGNSTVSRSPVVRNTHITKLCSASFYYLQNIRRIRRYLSRDSTKTLVHAFVSNRLDYCTTFAFLDCLIYKLRSCKRVQNAAT